MTKKSEFSNLVHDAFSLAEHVVKNDDLYPDQFVASPTSGPMVATLFSGERRLLLLLLSDLKEHGEHQSIGDLAICVNRDPTRVSRNLNLRIRMMLVETTRHDKTKSVRAMGRPQIIQ